MYIFYENYSQIFAGDLSAIDIALQGCFANIFQTFFAAIWVTIIDSMLNELYILLMRFTKFAIL